MIKKIALVALAVPVVLLAPSFGRGFKEGWNAERARQRETQMLNSQFNRVA